MKSRFTTTRRACLLGAASLVAMHCAPASRAPIPAKANGKPIVVVGAGIAGLAAAIDLADRGLDVLVLEAQSRPGGRILTLRAPFSGGSYVEAGAAHVGADPALLALVSRANVELIRPKPPVGLAEITYSRGKRTRLPLGEESPRQHVFTPEEEKLGFRGRLDKYFGSVTKFDAEAAWPPPALARHDAQNAVELLTELGASPGYIEDFGSNMVGEPLSDVSGAFVLREMAGFFHDVAREGGGRVAGGTDRLPHALAAQLGERISYGAEVKRIEHGPHGVRVSFLRRGVVEHVDAERVVCAIPFAVLRHVEVAPAFSPAKQRAVHELRMVSVARMFAQFDRRFWVERGEAGDAETDLPTGNVRDETKLQPGVPGVLGAYLSANAARRMTSMSEAERVRMFVQNAEKVHPGAAEHFIAGSGITKCWDEDPFARGAYAWFEPGQMTSFGGAMASPEGRVHFAGDHTSHRPGWMHGAVASAKRVVGEVLAARAA